MQMVIHQLVSNDLVVQHVELEPNETFKPHCDSEMMASNMQMCNKYAIRMHYAELRMHYAKLRIFYANHLRSNYAGITQKIRKYITQNYAKITQIIYAIITQTLRNVYAKLRKDVYAQYAIITQMCLRKHYAHFPCLRNYITQILRK